MATLYKPQSYPPAVREAILSLSPTALQIANRWMRDWPYRTRMLLRTGQYLDRLIAQSVAEASAYSPDNLQQMPRHEIAQIYQLRPGPPTR